MPVTILHFFRHTFRAFFIALIFFGITVFSPSAYADPHAVFYTDRAQEQLFYNTLAALNQADFVEPVSNNQYSRAILLARRSSTVARTSPQPGDRTFIAEQNPVINSTRTDLPAILSRSITLEGNDLWTAYLINQFALETTTRRSEDELARTLCERGLGRVQCNRRLGRSQQQSTAFITQPATESGKLDVAVNSALSSGLTSETALRQKIGDPNNTTRDPVYRIPRPNSPALAGLNKNIQGNPDALNFMSIVTGNALNDVEIDPDTLEELTFDKNGLPSVPENTSASEYVRKLNQISSLPSKLYSVGQKAYQQAVAFRHYTQNPTAIADYKLVAESPNGDGGLIANITTPVSAKLDAISSLAALQTAAATSQKSANPAAIGDPGDTRIIETDKVAIPPSPAPTPPLIFVTNPSSGNPQVAGISTELYNLYRDYYDNPPDTALSPNANLINPNRERGLHDGLLALTDNTYRKGNLADSSEMSCAFCIQLDQVLEKFTISNVLCSLFPTLNVCVNNKTI
jgi:hypothetical protein